MTIIRPNAMPRFWWLVPWAYARTLHRAANALRALSDKQDDTIAKQSRIIIDQQRIVDELKKNSEYERIYRDVVETLNKHNL